MEPAAPYFGQPAYHCLSNQLMSKFEACLRILHGRRNQARAFRFFNVVEKSVGVTPSRVLEQVEGKGSSDYRRGSENLLCVLVESRKPASNNQPDTLRNVDPAELQVAPELPGGICKLALLDQMLEQLFHEKRI